jgi:exonuclease VII small subunit
MTSPKGVTFLNTRVIIDQLEAERDALERAIAALRRGSRASLKRGRRRRRLSADARKRISEGMKKRWAARKRSA